MRILTRRDTGLINQWTFGRQVIQFIGLDPDASAFILATGISNTTIINAINILVINLKNNGIWTKMNAIYPFVGGTSVTHKYNLKDPRDLDAAFRLNFIGGWTHSSNGAQPNGTNAYADTFLIPNTTLSLNSTHISFYSRTITSGGTTIDISAIDSSLYISSQYSTSGIITNINNLGFTGANTNPNSQGFYCSSRISNTTYSIYKNNLNLENRNIAATTRSLSKIILASLTTTSGFSAREQAFASIGIGLTATEVGNYYTAVQAFQTSLSRQV
jgi:hypothetical protein